MAIALHRNGHTQGDDFALYLRQARSLFDGDVAQVVADNRFTVINSGGAFSPIAYPWGWPLLLSPFVHLWGYDYDRLKLLEVAAFCVWLVLVHGIVRRRAGRLLALAVTAVVATAPALLAHTDQLLSEYPHAAVVAAFIWWIDRIKAGRPLIAATRPPARRARRDRRGGLQRPPRGRDPRRRHRSSCRCRSCCSPGAAARGCRCRGGRWPRRTPRSSASVIGFQLLLPSMLMPDNGDSPTYVLDRLGDYTGVLTEQLGLGRHPAIGVLILVLAGVGMVVGCVRRPRLDVPLAALTVLSAATVSTHFRMVGRYYFQILPWVLYFAAVGHRRRRRAACCGARDRRLVAARRRRAAAVPRRRAPRRAARRRRRGPRLRPRAGASRSGRPTRRSRPIFDAVQEHTDADRRRRLLPGPHDDAVHRPAHDPDDEHRPRPAHAPTTSPSCATPTTRSRTSRRSRPRRSGSSRSGRTTAGSCGASPSPSVSDVAEQLRETRLGDGPTRR